MKKASEFYIELMTIRCFLFFPFFPTTYNRTDERDGIMPDLI